MNLLALVNRNKLVLLYALITVAYIWLTLAASPDDYTLQKYHLTESQLKLLSLSIVLPVIAIWATGLIGYLRLRSYVSLIKKSRDGAAFRTIAYGILWLGLWLPLSSLSSSLAQRYYQVHPSATASMVRIDTYFNMVLLFVAFCLVYVGSRKLLPLIKKPDFAPPMPLVLAYIAFAAVYVVVTLHDPARTLPQTEGTTATFYQTDWPLVLTIIIPRLLMWFLGIVAVYNIYLYSTSVKGSLYRSSLASLAIGLGVVVGVTVLLRFLQSVGTSLYAASLMSILIIVYLLLIAIGTGYVFIAKGAQNLRKLEDV